MESSKLIPSLLGLITIMIGVFLGHSCQRDDRQDTRLAQILSEGNVRYGQIIADANSKRKDIRDTMSLMQAKNARLEERLSAVTQRVEITRIVVMESLGENIMRMDERIMRMTEQMSRMEDKDNAQR